MIENAKWITAPCDMGDVSPDFRREIKLSGMIKNAVLSVTAVGLYECRISGKKVGNAVLTPGCTSYRDHIQYQTYDVTDMITDGCTLSVLCGKGWAVGHIGYDYLEKRYADEVHCIFSLDIEYKNGEKQSIVSDGSTDVYASQVIYSDIYDGETEDKTAECKFLGKASCKHYETRLIPQEGEWVKEQELVYPAEMIITPKGERVIDFGQNMTGYVCVRARGKRGCKISFRYAEILDRDGNFYTENLRKAKSTDRYILSGSDEILKPAFTFHGFRYICIDEYPGEPCLDDFYAVEVHSDIMRTGSFLCGNEKINRLYSNIIWSQKDNFLDIPTDCPQRDERLGWTGDAQVFARTAAINFDVEKFFSKWLHDVRCEQEKNGGIRAFAPDCSLNDGQNCCAAWGDVIVICPWEMYRAYGDKKILEDNFDAMCRWIDYMYNAGQERYLWLGGEQFGDWLGLDNGSGSLDGATDKDLVASCYFAYSTAIVAKIAKILGKDFRYYENLHKQIVSAIRGHFLDGGLPKCRTQTACVLLIYFDICEDKMQVGALLKELIRQNDNKLATGFVGTPYLLSALSQTGNIDIAYNLLFEGDFPSWLYAVNRGATTMWEHWDGIKEDGSFWKENMNSFNHYAYGSVYAWIFETVGGINIADGGEGYSRITVSPKPDRRLGFARVSIKSRSGEVMSSWKYQDGLVRYEIEVPKNTTAKISLPDGKNYVVGGGKYIFYTKEN